MKKILSLFLVVGLVALLTSCAGSDGTTNIEPKITPNPGSGEDVAIGPEFDPFADPGTDSDDDVSGDDSGSSQNSANMRVTDFGFKGKSAECGKPFSGTLIVKNVDSDVTWTVKGLPDWAKQTPSGTNKATLKITGTPPYITCDPGEQSVTVKACSSNDICKDLSTKFKVTIPKISIKNTLKSTTVHFGGKLDLTLSAIGGSGSYEWTTILPKELTGESSDKEVTGSDISISAGTVGLHNIIVKVVDSALANRQAAIAEKLGQDVDTVAGALKSFTLKVNEEGFVIRAAVIDVEREAIVQNLSSGEVVTEVGEAPAVEETADAESTDEAPAVEETADAESTDEATADETADTESTDEATADETADTESTDEATAEASETPEEEVENETPVETVDTDLVEVPYRGKLNIWVEGNSESYDISVVYNDTNIMGDISTTLAKDEKADIISVDSESLDGNLEIGNITITAKNALGDVETLEIKDLVVITDPCKALKIDSFLNANVKVGGTFNDRFAAKSGNGPFRWEIVSSIEGPGTGLDQASALAPDEDSEDSADCAEDDEDCNTNANSAKILYSREVDTETARWELTCNDKDCRELSISGTAHYNLLPSIFGFGEELANFDDMPSSMDFRENFHAKVYDEGCEASYAEINNVLHVKVPEPRKQTLEDVRIYHYAGINNTYQGTGQSYARMRAISTGGEKIAETNNYDISINCGETGSDFHRWNWPVFQPIDAYGTLADLDHILLILKQSSDASWDLDYKVQKLFIIGGSWYYHDGEQKHFKANDDGKDKEHKIPIEENGKWFLKCDSGNPDSVGCGQSVGTSVSSDRDDCS
ncbi:MAG: hypothetical protein HN337_09755 [Deltaproteobacteria bacterium]|nr:hypothetical protein [Deltaproteobacteria bacterium]